MKNNDYNQVNLELVKEIKKEKNEYNLGVLLKKLFENNKGMISKLVYKKFKLFGFDAEEANDVIAMNVLYQCAMKYDIESNNNFSTYLQSSLNNELTAYINESSLVSPYIKKQISLINEFKKDYTNKYNKEPDVKTIANELGLKESKVKEFELYGNFFVSTEDGDYDKRIDKLSIEDDLISEEQKAQLDKSIEALDSEEKELLFLYFGLNGNDEHSYNELAKMYNKSDETIRQKIIKILLKIKNNNGV